MHDDEFRDIRTIDPIEGDRLAEEWASSGAKHALFQAITMSDAPPLRKLHRRSPKRLAALAATLAVAATALAVAGLLPGADTPAYAVRQLENGVIQIENVADLHDPSGLEKELREFGVDVQIVPRPVSPSMVGQARATTDALGEDEPVEGLTFGGNDGTKGVFTWMIDPRVFRDRITIELYVQADQGEGYDVSEEVFEPGEVLGGLQCALGEPLQAADVASRLSSLGLTAQWEVLTAFETDSDGGTYTTQPSAEVPNGQIISGYAVDGHTVRFEVLPDGQAPPDWLKPRLSDIPCSKEQAARWK